MITYKKGNLFDNLSKDKMNLVLHVNNNIGAWGAGFVVSITNRVGENPYRMYSQWYKNGYYNSPNKNKIPFELGQIQVAATNDKNTYICNMIAQNGCGHQTFKIGNKKVDYPPFRPDSFRECIYRVAEKIYGKDINLVSPLMGCGLSGSSKEVVFGIVDEVFGNNIDLTVWEL